jgi:hypothetical protein
MSPVVAAASSRATDWPLIWSAVTAIATAALFISVPVAVIALAYTRRADAKARRESEARRWDSYLGAACMRFLKSQRSLTRMAERAKLSGKKITGLDAAIEDFEATFIELELVATNDLVKSAQMLWAQTVGTITEDGFSKSWPRRYADDQRQAFLEQVRKHFGLPELYESSAEVLRRVDELNNPAEDG